ncbi:MAG: DUF3592 domain-containing protein [Anaerolineaceae bacterium]|nr:MAG: DUF3592 domain-containing protein [Anaerolineaceae bacterium]
MNRGVYVLEVLFVYFVSLIAGFAFGVFRRVSNQKRTEGVIVDLRQKHRNQSGRTTYTGIVKYEVNGRQYQVETAFQSSSYRRGKKVVVYFNEDDPSDSFVRAAVIVYLFTYFLILLGTIMLLNEAIIYFSRG